MWQKRSWLNHQTQMQQWGAKQQMKKIMRVMIIQGETDQRLTCATIREKNEGTCSTHL